MYTTLYYGKSPTEDWTLEQLLEQLEKCNFECEGGSLITNAAYMELKGRVKTLSN